jgi:citrate synthase
MATPKLLTAKQACAQLGVKPATLYTYVSRGLIRGVEGEAPRQRRYLAEDVARVRTRAEARRGHRAVAAGALRFGDPVLDTAICAAGPVHLAYRGRDVVALVEAGTPFEAVAALLWAAPDPGPWTWPQASLLARQPPGVPELWRFARLVPKLAEADPARGQHGFGADPERARRLIRAFAASVGPTPGAAPRPRSIAETLASRLGVPARAIPALDAALVLVAEHELNVSTFAARVAASGGADLYAAVGAALYAFSGPRHGGMPSRVDGLVEELGRPARVKAALLARLERGETVPGFGHPMYPGGDPRTAPLVRWAERLATRRQEKLRTLLAMAEVMEGLGPHGMTVDGGLLALAYALGFPPASASGLFAVGRVAGWAAHVFEQRQTGALLRPRARYVGP